MNEKIFVIAGSHQQHKDYVKKSIQKHIDAGKTISLSNFVYVSGPEVFRGWNEVHGVFVGSFRERSDIRDIVREIRRINNIDPGREIVPGLFVGRGLNHKPLPNPVPFPPFVVHNKPKTNYVYMNGVIQPPDSYTVVENMIYAVFTFKTAPIAGTTIPCQYDNSVQMFAANGTDTNFSLKLALSIKSVWY